MMLNGASALGQDNCRLDNVVFIAPLPLNDTEACTLQALLGPEGDFRIVSFREPATDAMTVHATGSLSQASSDVSSLIDLPEIQKRCTREIDFEALLGEIIGLEFGPSFRWIDGIWAGSRETIARLRLPDTIGNTEGYWLHPGLLDACFQVAGSSLEDAGDDMWLAFGLKSLDISRAAGEGPIWWCHSKQVGDSIWDLRLLDASGSTVAEIRGFEVRKTSAVTFQQQRTADWLYRIEWQRKPQAALAPAGPGEWLVIDSGLFAEELAQYMRQRGRNVSLAHHDAIPSIDSEQVVYVCDAHDDLPTPVAAENLAIDLLKLVQILSRRSRGIRLRIVTKGSQAIADNEISELGMRQAPVWGFVRTLVLEHPELRCTCIDVSAKPSIEEMDGLLNELSTSADDAQVAYRGSHRYVAQLVSYRNSPAAKPDGPFRLQLAEYGSADKLRLAPLTRRVPGRGEVEVEVKASAMNFRDVLVALGLLKDHYEKVLNVQRAEDVRLGFDCAGTIVAVGEGVKDFKPGDEVMSSAMGSFASFMTLPATDVVHKPLAIRFEAAATIPTVFFTAHYGLFELACLKPGERVLIHAASGGVGQAAIQLAQAIGAEIFATASPSKWPILKSQGVQHLMNSRTLEFAGEIARLTGGEGVDVVLNSLTGDAIDKSFEVLKPTGRFVEIGKLDIWTSEQVQTKYPGVAYYTFDVVDVINRDPSLVHKILGEVSEWYDAERLHAIPHSVFPVQEAVEAYRYVQQTRHVGKVVLSFAAQEATPVRADSTYLITGGLGGLGLSLAQHLVERGARYVVLTGRSAPSERSQQTIDAMVEAGAQISVIRADVSKPGEVKALVAACQAQAPLRGIVHAAGVLDDGIIDNQTPERFTHVMAPKIHGAWSLHLETQSLPLDFFVCFSSMASMAGAAGQANYSAANAFLDGLSHYRRSQGLPGLSIDWGPWAEVGMAADLSVAGQGIEKIAIVDGLRVFDELLSAQRSGPAQIGVWHALSPVVASKRPAGTRSVKPKEDFLRRFHDTPDSGRQILLESAIQAELVQVLGLGAERQPPPTQPWAELGVDSLMMVELRNRLEGFLHITLPVERLVRDMNTRGLAGYVAERLQETDTDSVTDVAAPALSSADELEKAYQLVVQIPQAFVTAEKQEGRRILTGGRWRYDFASCNYLGLDLHPEVIAAIPPAIAEWGVHPSWTRAVASPQIYDDLERELAAFVGAPTTLAFPSISLLHMGVLPVLAGYDGVILKDTDAHHSLHEGCLRAQANGAEWVNFPHSDIADLERKLARYRSRRTKIIATDGVYSMGSSHPPLKEYVRLAREHNALVYVDDAHGLGIIGEKPDAALPYGYRGNGMVRHFGLDYVQDRIVYVAGMSKAFSSYAAFVTCFDEKMKWNLQSAGPFVFSGPTCTASLASALAGLRVNAKEGDEQRRRIYKLTRRFVEAVRAIGFEIDNGEFFPIVGVVMGSFENFANACQLLWQHDILITPAMYPAVPIERNLVRFSITAANSEEEIDIAIRALEAVWSKLHGVSQMSQASVS
jgi:myxalamid-type polyketide synthase MxaB